MRRPAVLLMGPTGSGKTDLAAHIVARLPLEIVSVDAAMVYREMDIGTAKSGAELLARAPHHLIDLVDPADTYSAARFIADAANAVREIEARGRTALFAGGTMLYFRALQSGLARLPEADWGLRRRLEERAAAQGWPALHDELARRDPATAARIQPNDRQRIQRALEVIELSGRPLSGQLAEDLRRATHHGDLRLVLAPADRTRHARHLAARFEDMMRRGLLDEVRALHARRDLHPAPPAMRLIGYRQLWRHLEGEAGLDSAVADAIVATRQLARRQLTWLRAEPETLWLDPQDPRTPENIAARVTAWLANR